jgi:ABC-2 type transport system permease protein
MKLFAGVVVGFFRRELADLTRQRMLIVLTILGPFVILMAFGAGYRDERLVLRTVFVGPDDETYTELLETHAERFTEFIDNRGYTSDLFAARGALERGEIDAVVVFPLDPVDDILDGRRSEVSVIHDQLNPIQRVAVGFAVRIATDEVNQAVVEQILAQAQAEAAPYRESITVINQRRQVLEAATGADQDEALDELAEAVGRLRDQTTTLEAFWSRYGTEQEREQLGELRDELDVTAEQLDVLRGGDQMTDAERRRLDDQLGRLEEAAELVESVDPAVLARPFLSRTETLSAVEIDQTDFFGAAAVALLLQHLAMSLGALTFVRDRAMGLFELIRVGPVGATEVLLGKLGAFFAVGAVVGATLLGAIHFLLGVPVLGAVGWLVGLVGLLLVASIGIGFVVSLLARSDTQAVQYAMLILLASLFFSGFFIDHERFRTVVSGTARLLPVTSAISGLQDVMLRGRPPQTIDVVVLGALAAGSIAVAWFLLRRELRTT